MNAHAMRVLTPIIALLAIAAAAFSAQAEPPETFEPGTGKYILVLKDPRTDVNDPATGKKKAKEPDVAKHGGKVLHKKDAVRIVKMPVARIKALRLEENVAYVQRVWLGESLENWDEQSDGASLTAEEDETALETDLTWTSGTYAYDGSGNIKQIGTDTYLYDSAGRLIQAIVKGTSATFTTESYKYDSFGNLTEKTIGAVPKPIAVDASSNRLQGETYDVAGNVTTRAGTPAYSYDSMAMMDSVTKQTIGTRRMIYGPDDERIGVIHDPGLSRWKIRDFSGKVLREYKSDDPYAVWHWMEDYVYGEGRLIGGDRESYYGGKRHFHTDHLGSVRMITDQNRLRRGVHDYLPFGVEQTDSVQEFTKFATHQSGDFRADPMKYTSHERDFHGPLNYDNTDYLDYMHARYYDPNMGRFLSVDPFVDYEVAMKNPQGWNRYAYVRNNPMNRTDPTGRCEDKGKGDGGKRICIQTFIPTKSLGIFRGDNRGPKSNGGTFRTSQTLTLTPGGHGATKQEFTPGVSQSGPLKRDGSIKKEDVKGTPQGVNVEMKSSDGLLFGTAPKISYDLMLQPTADGGVKVGGTHSGYPGLEVWMYQDGQKPQLLYSYDPPEKGFFGATRAIGQTVTVPEDEP